MKSKLFLFVFLFLSLVSPAQELTLQEYLSWVVREHPLMQTACLKPQYGEAQLLQVKGLFDPVLESKFKQKFFAGQNYYTYSTTGITYPTPYAISLVSQVDVNNGYYVNPLDYTKNSGLLSVGVSVPLLKGLVVDERRMAKQRAEKIQEAYLIEKTIAINELLYQSTLLYINWWYTSLRFDITKNIAETTLQRHLNMRQRFFGGDRAAIDTVETYTQVQNRRIQVSESELDLIKSRIALVAFLSDSTTNNLMLLTAQAVPEKEFASRNTFNVPLLTIMQQIELHPELLLYNNKVQVLEIEKKWKEEKLKPKLNVEYYALQQPLSPDTWNPYLSNYKWGVEFSSPLFLREARGDLKLQQLKIQETDLNREWKSNQILQKSQSIEASAVQLKTQMQNATKNVSLYKQLLDAENKKLELGESSLFLVNTRENSYFESLMKELELKTKNSVAHTDWNFLWFLPYE